MAVTINRHELLEMKRWTESLGVPFKSDASLNPRVDCSQSPLELRLTPAELVEIDLEDPDRLKGLYEVIDEKMTGPPPTYDRVYHCGAGQTSYAVNPYGELTMCVLSQQDRYDLREGTLREGFDEYLGELRVMPVTRPTPCVRCGIRHLCNSCAATGELEAGEKQAPVDFLCRTAHLRAHTLGATIPEHGDCRYCHGGDGEAELAADAARLRDRFGLDGAGRSPVIPGTGRLRVRDAASAGSSTGSSTRPGELEEGSGCAC